jgi:Domain of unknown function (DUF4352)
LIQLNVTVRILVSVLVLFACGAVWAQGLRKSESNDAAEFISTGIASGTIRMECDSGKAWINHDLWLTFDRSQKSDAAHYIWFACAGFQGKTSVNDADDLVLYDMQSGKKLATYSKRHGFNGAVSTSETETDGFPNVKPAPQVTDERRAAEAAQREFFDIVFNKWFRLGRFSYRIIDVGSYREVGAGVQSVHQSAPAGSHYVMVDYNIQNKGEQDQERSADYFAGNFRLRCASKSYEADDDITKADAIANNRNLITLPSGASADATVAFVVPDRVTASHLQLIISDPDETKAAVLKFDLVLEHSTKPRKKKATNSPVVVGKPISEEQLRIWKRLERPPNTPYRGFVEDNYR